MSTFDPNSVRLDNYNVALNREIGSGGVATVYAATHIYLGIAGAVKLLRQSIRSTSPDAPTVRAEPGGEDVKIELTYEMRFKREAKLLASMRHPHIIPILEAGLTEISHQNFGLHQPYFIMPYLPFTLAKLTSGKRLPLDKILAYVEQIAGALDYAYLEKGIVHRDLKPSNVLVESDEKTVLLSDFGSALLTTAAETSKIIIGTWPYAAPEQIIRKEGTRGYSDTTDQFSLAVMVYEWICGVRPFPYASRDYESYRNLYEGHDYRVPSFAEKGVKDIDSVVEDVVRKALSLNPKDRFDTNMDFVEALRSAAHRHTRRNSQPGPVVTEAEERRKQQERIASLVGQLTQSKKLLQELEAQLEDEFAIRHRLDDFITQQRNQLVEANQRIDKLLDEQEQAKNDKTKLQDQLTQLIQEVYSLTKEKSTLAGKIRKLKTLLSQAESRIQELESLLARQKEQDDASMHYTKGIDLFYLDRYGEALQEFNQALAVEPSSRDAHRYKAEALFYLDRYEEALQAYEQALALTPPFYIGSSLNVLERYAIASQSFIESLPIYAYAPHNKGAALFHHKRYVEVFQAYNQALALEPYDADALRETVLARLELYEEEEALQVCNQALAVDPRDAYALHHKGVALSYLKRYEEALQAFNKLLALRPHYEYALHNKGFVLYKLKQNEEALEAYDQALAMWPDNVNTLTGKGATLGKLKRYDEAIQVLDQSLTLRPDNVDTLYEKGIVLVKLGHNDEAIRVYNQALAVETEADAALDSKHELLALLNRGK